VEKGFRATKMEDIAREAGVTKGTPYLYYENKEEIFKAVIREGMLTKFDELEGLSGQDEASAETRLRQVIYRWWESIGNTRLAGLSKLMIAEAANFPELASFYHAEVIMR
jgi:AcrR family transcriptional regulator